MTTVVTSYGHVSKRAVDVDTIQIHDLWHIAMRLPTEDQEAVEAVLDVWHLAHDLLKHIREEKDTEESVRVGKALCQQPTM